MDINIITKIYKLQLITMLFSHYVCGMSQMFVQCECTYKLYENLLTMIMY